LFGCWLGVVLLRVGGRICRHDNLLFLFFAFFGFSSLFFFLGVLGWCVVFYFCCVFGCSRFVILSSSLFRLLVSSFSALDMLVFVMYRSALARCVSAARSCRFSSTVMQCIVSVIVFSPLVE